MLQDGPTSKNIKGKPVSLELSTATQGKLVVNNTKNPIKLVLPNKEDTFDKRNVSLRVPGLIVFEEFDADPHGCNMMFRLQKEDVVVNLTVLIQYGEAPKIDEYDVKMWFPDDFSVNNSVIDIQAENYKIIDDRTFMMWNMSSNRYAYCLI